ncbi:MAG: hypothetical protein WC408_03120 [Candidatus Micrarchaeia archaeon]|jgi:uncharacterized protein (DUF736 family)
MFYAGKFGRLPPLSQVLSGAATSKPGYSVDFSEYDAGKVSVKMLEPRAQASGFSSPEQAGNKPQFSVKAKGMEGYVGSGWINEGKYGKYISVKLRENLAPGTTIYLSPTKDNPEIL